MCGGKRNTNVFLTPVLNNTDTCDSIAKHVHVSYGWYEDRCITQSMKIWQWL